MDSKLERQLVKEIDAINKTLTAFGISAGCRVDKTNVGGEQVVVYKVGKADRVRISDLERVMREVSEAVSRCRRQTTMLRLLTSPLRIETTHPFRLPLEWNNAALTGQPHALLLGRTYDPCARDLWLSFDNAPHILTAGTTGAGKSVELANMLLGLCWNTSPADLRIVLIDLKNTDLVPFRRLPHVEVLATDLKPAFDALRNAGAILKQRQGNHSNTPRLLIVVDEYTDLVGDREAMSHADRIARQGRSAGVNLLVATQHPTSKALGGSTIKNNFNNRIVGLVADANAAANAAGRPGTHAELLPGKGAFLWINGPDAVRFQSYNLNAVTIESLITRIVRKWRSEQTTVLEPVLRTAQHSLVVEPLRTSSAPVLEPLRTGSRTTIEPLFPLTDRRPLTRIEADECRRLTADGMSKSELCRTIYGSKNGQYMEWVNEALAGADNKIIRLPRTGTGGD